tara:strand:+ start:1229 stop:1624 length:396 start_codon:yes stop_codon:yes gene_type:complete
MIITRRHRKKADINIIPLVDVLMVLIFFFLMTMQFKNLNTLNITVPQIDTAGTNKLSKQLVIAIDEEGEFYLNTQRLSKEELSKTLQVAGEVNPDIPILLVADENTPLHKVTLIIDLCRKSHLSKFKIQSR